MAESDYKEILESLKDAVLAPVKAGASEFLEENADAREFLEDRAKRLAELGVELVKAPEGDRARIRRQMEVVAQSIRNEASQLALGAAIEARERFGKIVEAAAGALVKWLPAIVGAL